MSTSAEPVRLRLIGATLLLGESLGARQLVALALTLTGVALAVRG